MCLAISIYENKASAFYYIENESQRERERQNCLRYGEQVGGG